MNLSIIVPVKNDATNLKACLISIRDANAQGVEYEIIVMDNGSTDDTVAIANEYATKVIVVPDLTVAALRNQGAEESTGDILAFIDADCTVSPSWFQNLKPYLQDETIVGFGSPPGIPEKATWVQRCWYQIRRKGSPDQGATVTTWLESMNLFVRRGPFNQVGGFDSSLETCEDYDLCLRLKELGEIYNDGRISAIHHGEAPTVSRFYQKERWRGVSNIQSLRKHGFALSELPSVLFPLMQVFIVIAALLGLLLVFTGTLKLTWWIVAILIWQTPLLLLSMKKSNPLQQAGGILVLLNTYFIARGLSLFSGTAWEPPKT